MDIISFMTWFQNGVSLLLRDRRSVIRLNDAVHIEITLEVRVV